MTNAVCSGWDLDGDAHRVLSQLSVRVKAKSGLINVDSPLLARALSMDERVWLEHFSELTYLGFVDAADGKHYIAIRCTCERADGMPKIGAKSLRPQGDGPVHGSGWGPIGSGRNGTPRSEPQIDRRPSGREYSPVGGVREAGSSITSRQQSVDERLVGSAKSLRKVRVKARSVPAEPKAVEAASLRELRMAFKKKWDESGILDKLKLPATHVLDPVESGVFIKVLKTMRQTEGMSVDQVLAIMDTFMAMVLSREIDITGKHVWRVFVARRTALLERSQRTARFGSGEGILRGRGQSDETLDRLLGRRVDQRPPSE